jgi:glutamyl-tRNA reductase
VRNQTAIGKHKLSVASVAVDLARHIYGELTKARLLVVGAGEIAELAMKYLLSAGCA